MTPRPSSKTFKASYAPFPRLYNSRSCIACKTSEIHEHVLFVEMTQMTWEYFGE